MNIYKLQHKSGAGCALLFFLVLMHGRFLCFVGWARRGRKGREVKG